MAMIAATSQPARTSAAHPPHWALETEVSAGIDPVGWLVLTEPVKRPPSDASHRGSGRTCGGVMVSISRRCSVAALMAAAVVVGIAGPAFADYESDIKGCGKEYGWTRTMSVGITYATPPGGRQQYVGNFARMHGEKTYASVTGGGFWDASAEVLNKSETYAGCIYYA